VVHVPLSEAARATFNETAALAWFESVEGLEYGYHSLLWGWVDTQKDNYPCLPPDYSRCLEWDFLEVGGAAVCDKACAGWVRRLNPSVLLGQVAFALLDRHVPAIADLLWIDAFNLRLGTQNLRTAELWQETSSQGMTSAELPTLVEQDSFMYHTTRYNSSNPVKGRSMVCCVFVCSVWKAAGVFESIGNELNCGELTNYDDYSLKIFRGDYVQIAGDYGLYLNDFRTRDMYEHMDEKCPSLPPKYERPDHC
jgi:hypothetical protein